MTTRDRGWLIFLAVWSVVLWPVYQHFDQRGERVEARKPVVEPSHESGVISQANHPHNDSDLDDLPETIHRDDEIGFRLPSDAVGTVPRTVEDGPGVGNLDRARRLGNWVRHGSEDWEWVASGMIKVEAIGGSWLIGDDKAIWMPSD